MRRNVMRDTAGRETSHCWEAQALQPKAPVQPSSIKEGLPASSSHIEPPELVDKAECLRLRASVDPAFGETPCRVVRHPAALRDFADEVLVDAVHQPVQDPVLLSCVSPCHRKSVSILSRLQIQPNTQFQNNKIIPSISEHAMGSFGPIPSPCHLTLRHTITPRHIPSKLIVSHLIVSHHITSHLISPHHISSDDIRSHLFVSHRITPYHVTPHPITSHCTTSHHMASHHITSHDMTSHRIRNLP